MPKGGQGLGVGNQGPEGVAGSGAWGAILGLVGILGLALAASYQGVSVVRAGGAWMPGGLAARAADIRPVDPEGPLASTAEVASAGSSGEAFTSDSPETLTAAALNEEYPLQSNPLSGCSICHVDIEDEFIGSLHFEEKVGCITCHGPSEGHLADENNEVKPDQLFARGDVRRLCERCHECSRPKPEKPEVTRDGQRKVCIDCHGSHDVALAADAGVPTR